MDDNKNTILLFFESGDVDSLYRFVRIGWMTLILKIFIISIGR